MNDDDLLMDAMKRNLEGIGGSDIFTSLWTGKTDPIFFMQMGIAMYLDKPIYLLVVRGTKIPENLRKVARRMIYVDPNDEKSMQQATEELAKAVHENDKE